MVTKFPLTDILPQWIVRTAGIENLTNLNIYLVQTAAEIDHVQRNRKKITRKRNTRESIIHQDPQALIQRQSQKLKRKKERRENLHQVPHQNTVKLKILQMNMKKEERNQNQRRKKKSMMGLYNCPSL